MSHHQHADVRAFHILFGHPVHTHPRHPEPELLELRRALVSEEYGELRAAIDTGDRVGILDALVDIAYVTHGWLHAIGMPYRPDDTFGPTTLDQAVTALLGAFGLPGMGRAALATLARCRTLAEAYGLPFDAAWDEVHASNLRKVWPDGKVHYRADGKILKPEGFVPPNLHGVLVLAGAL